MQVIRWRIDRNGVKIEVERVVFFIMVQGKDDGGLNQVVDGGMEKRLDLGYVLYGVDEFC